MKRNKRGALQLSVNTIVVIVIAVVLLSLGLVWVRGIINKLEVLTDEAFLQADREIKERMGSDEKFYISGVEFEVDIGKSQTINVGINNLLGRDTNFRVVVEGADDKSDPGWFIVPKAQVIKSGEKKGIPIVIQVPKSSAAGEIYLYTIKAIAEGGEEYGSQTVVVKSG
jgi:hypothetical protein